jgi:hypothetical protein
VVRFFRGEKAEKIRKDEMMNGKNILNKIMVIIGTVLVWFPIITPILLGLSFLGRRPVFRVDYLMPAELFPVVLVGGLLLLWSSLRMKALRGLVISTLVGSVVFYVGMDLIAVATGLASGATQPAGWQFALVITVLILYILVVIAMGIAGILLWRLLFIRKPVS